MRGRVAYVTINRPEVRNALNPEAHRQLSAIWEGFCADDSVWVAILTGAGDRAFCAGNDLKAMAGRTDRPSGEPSTDGLFGGFGGMTGTLIPKPIIAAVNGYALGGGLEIALACDIIVAAEHAQFGLPEPKVGLLAGAGGVHRLPEQLPLKVAMGMLLTGRSIDAHEAHRLGLVNEVVPADQLLAAAERWAEEILRCSPVSVRLTKEAAMSGLGRPAPEAMGDDVTSGRYRRLQESADFTEGPRAFTEKRPPVWTGR